MTYRSHSRRQKGLYRSAKKNKIDLEHEAFSCGHFTMRHAPYSYIMFFKMLSFFKKNL
jgi:hypothetical protein